MASGVEQGGCRPALALSPAGYNGRVGLAIFCPLTNRDKAYPFEVSVPADLPVSGVVLSDRVKSLDWRARGAAYACSLPDATTAQVLQKLGTLVATARP